MVQINKVFLLGLSILAITITILNTLPNQKNQSQQNQNQNQNDISIAYKAISGMIRSDFTAVINSGDKIYVGDGAGGVSIWDYTSKKYALNFSDNSRPIQPKIQSNPVTYLQATAKSIVALTSKGIKSFQLGVSGQLTGKSADFDLKGRQISLFTLMDTGNGVTHFLTISTDKKQLCLHKLGADLNNPNPIQLLNCNKTTNNSYLDVKYSPTQGLIAVGDSKDLIIFQYSSDSFGHLMGLTQPKSDQTHFKAFFPPKTQDQNKQILTVNGLYLNMIIYDQKTPEIKILQSQKTADGLFAKGFSDQISISPATGQRTVLINGQNKGIVYKINNKTQKLSKVNETKVTDGFSNFVLYSTDTFFRVKNLDLSVYQIKQPSSSTDDYFYQHNSYNSISPNHFNEVSGLATYGNYFVSSSNGGKDNLKLWRMVNQKLTLLDTTTLSYFSILKSSFLNPKTILMLPPLKISHLTNQKSIQATDTLHILVAGDQPYNLILIPISTTDKFQAAFKTKDQHSNNVTVLLTNDKQSGIISASLDGTIKTWTLDSTRKNLTLIDTAVSKDGNIAFGLIDKTGTHLIFGHNGNDKSSLVNITIWDYDENKHKVTKKVGNVAGESHESNLTALLMTHNQKYLISYSQSGQLRLWRHENWTMVDLLASLSLGINNAKLSLTSKDTLIVENDVEFVEYLIDVNGFVQNGQAAKQYKSTPTSNLLIAGSYLFSGYQQGCIRSYQMTI